MGLQVIFLLQSIYAWICWNKKSVSISELNFNNKILTIVSIISLSCLYYYISSLFIGRLILIDSITAGLSTMGIILLAKKKLEAAGATVELK